MHWRRGAVKGGRSPYTMRSVYLEEGFRVVLKPLERFAELFLGQLADPGTLETPTQRVCFVAGTDNFFRQSNPGKIYEFPFRDRVHEENL